MMKKIKKSLALILSMLMLISVFQVGASAYFPYINNGGASDAISSKYQITSVNVTDLYGDAVNSLNAGDGVLVSCKVKSLDESGSVQLIAVAYSGSEMVAVKRSDVVTLGKNAENIGVYLTVSKAADSFKAFLWDGSANLIPLTKSADTASDAVNVLSVEFNGEAVDKTETTHNVTIPVYQLDMPAVQILTDNPAARVEVTSNKAFPLTKQWDSAEGSATVTATVTLNGAEKAKYIFNVTQAVPQIIDATFYQWSDNTTTNAVTEEKNESSNSENVVLAQVKEADYSNLGYTQSQLSAGTPNKAAEKSDAQYFCSINNSSPHYGLIDIAPEFLNGTLIQITNKGADSNRAYSMYTMNAKSVKNASGEVVALTDTICVDDELYGTNGVVTPYTYSFRLDRSAMVYVYNKPDAKSTPDKNTVANAGGFADAGFVINDDIKLKYSNLNGGTTVTTFSDWWYEKHVEVTGEEAVDVFVPIGVSPMYVIIKFDEGQGESVVSNVSYTKTDNSTVTTTTTKLFDPIPEDEGMVFEDQKTTLALDNYIYKVEPWSGANRTLALTGIGEEVSGGEVIKLPVNPADIKNLTFTLNESADVYFVINTTSGATLGDWRTAALDWFEKGWHMLGQGNAPVEGFLYCGNSGTGRKVSYDDDKYKNCTVKKHFEVDTPVTVSLNLGKFQSVERFKATDDINHNQRTMLVIIKKTDR